MPNILATTIPCLLLASLPLKSQKAASLIEMSRAAVICQLWMAADVERTSCEAVLSILPTAGPGLGPIAPSHKPPAWLGTASDRPWGHKNLGVSAHVKCVKGSHRVATGKPRRRSGRMRGRGLKVGSSAPRCLPCQAMGRIHSQDHERNVSRSSASFCPGNYN